MGCCTHWIAVIIVIQILLKCNTISPPRANIKIFSIIKFVYTATSGMKVSEETKTN